MSIVQCVVKALFLTLTQIFGTIKSICVYRSAFMLTGKFHARTFRNPTRSCFVRSKENHRGKCACEVFSIE